MRENLKALHVLNRLAFGPRPGDIQRVNRIGAERYIDQQLRPESIPVPDSLSARMRQLNTLWMTPVELAREYGPPQIAGGGKQDPEAVKAARQRANVIMEQAVEARFKRAIEGPRQLQEVMVDFWFNHFNVFAGKGLDHLWTGAFEQQAIRPHTMGRFRDLLGATAKHPAMLFYLDNWQNTAPGSPGARGKFEGLNENYARELMELHTLGVDGGYTQQDVIALARILTGWTLVRPRRVNKMAAAPRFAGFGFGAFRFGPFAGGRGARMLNNGAAADPSGFYFDPSRHDSSDKVFLGHTIEGSGIAEGEQALDILARSPATAHHISNQLAQYFVADQPPKTLVRRLASRFLGTDGDVRAVLAELFHSPEFWDQRCYAAKFKTPYQYEISALRATGLSVVNLRPLAGMLYQLGMPLYGCQTPDGYKNTQDAWLNPDAMTMRLSFATALAAGRLPLDRAPAPGGGGMGPLNSAALRETLGERFSAWTLATVEAAPPDLRAALLLGSPEFMHH